jgi:lipopolysaccharide export system permease protein
MFRILKKNNNKSDTPSPFVEALKGLHVRTIDKYIIRKFIGTFVYAIILIIAVAVVFDISEKIDDFVESHAPLKAIIFDYYLNFIPYFAILYSNLFTFIAVVFFTSKLAYNTEIIAILSSGISYRRMLYPYVIGATLIAIFSYFMLNYVVPNSNKVRLAFEEQYIHTKPVSFDSRNIHKQVYPGVVIYMESYSNISNTAYKFSIEKFANKELVSKLNAEFMMWDSVKNKWTVRNYYIRDINGMHEKITKGTIIDTNLNITPEDFRRRTNVVESMNKSELDKFIDEQQLQGGENLEAYLIEKYKRVAQPFSTYILTIIGVCVSSRKSRGGTGLHIGIGMAFCFSYILFMQFSSQFSISGTLNPLLAVWIPNILFAIIAYYLYRIAPK